MSLSDLIKAIREHHYLFDVVVPGKTITGKQSIEQTEMMYGSLEAYFTKIASINNVQTLTVNLYAKNGNSPIRKATELVDIPNAEKSINPGTPVADKSQPVSPQKMMPMITKADIEVVQLRTENKFLQERVEDLRTRNKDLERTNADLYNENTRLTRENATEKDKRDLEYQKKEIELNARQKAGLSGVMEELKSFSPEAWQFIAGLFPNHPMAKNFAQAPEQQAQLSGAEQHADPDSQTCIEVIDQLLLKQTPEVVGMAAMLMEHLVTKPEILKTVYGKFFPEQVTNQTKEQPKNI